MKVESVKSVFIFLLKARIFKLSVQYSVPIFHFYIVIPSNIINKRLHKIVTCLTIKKQIQLMTLQLYSTYLASGRWMYSASPLSFLSSILGYKPTLPKLSTQNYLSGCLCPLAKNCWSRKRKRWSTLLSLRDTKVAIFSLPGTVIFFVFGTIVSCWSPVFCLA